MCLDTDMKCNDVIPLPRATAVMENDKLCTLFEIIEKTVQSKSENTALIYDDFLSRTVVSYKTLSNIIQLISSEIGIHCKEGDYICLDINNTCNSLHAFLSVIYIKAIACPLSLSKKSYQTLEFCYKNGIKFIIIEKQILKTVPGMKSLAELKVAHIHQLEALEDMVLLEIPYHSVTKEQNLHGIEFMISTSGSTGSPKAIKVPGKCIMSNITSLRDIFKLGREDVIFLSSPLTFDASAVQLFMSLAAKSMLLIVPTELKMQPSKLLKILFTRNKTTVLQATPSLVLQLGEVLFSTQQTFSNTSLRILCMGAEPFPSKTEIAKFTGPSPDIELFNLYGISEVSSWATIERISFSSLLEGEIKQDQASCSGSMLRTDELEVTNIISTSVPIGHPLKDTVIELRRDGKIVNDGLGDIWIGGKDRVCLIDDETDIIPNKMRPSGDIGLRKNGKLYYVGRKDHQVKLHGQFINLELVERSVEELNEVTSCALLGRYTTARTLRGLDLYVVSPKDINQHIVEKSISKTISRVLPDPNPICNVVFVDNIPLNPHGKKDRLTLRKEKTKESRDLLCPMESVLLDLFEQSVGFAVGKECLAQYDRGKNLVENGGDSFAAVFLENKIQEYLSGLCKKEFKPESLYDKILTQSFNELSKLIEHKLNTPNPSSKTKEISIEYDDSNMEGCQNEQVSNSTLKKRKRCTGSKTEDTSSKINVELSGIPSKTVSDDSQSEQFEIVNGGDMKSHGCSCSASRSGRMTVCNSCLAAGIQTHCSSVANCVGASCNFNFRERWHIDTGKCVDASPLVVCNGDHSSFIVYIGSHSHSFFAISGSDGCLLWKVELGDRIESSPAVSKCGSKIIVGCYDCCVYVISRCDGAVLWKYSTGESIKSSPVVNPTNGLAFIGSHDGHLHALDIDNKLTAWKTFCGGGSVFSSPTLSWDSETIYVGTLSGVGLAASAGNGKVKWKFCVNKPIFSSPGCYRDFVCFCCVDGKIYLLHKDGKLLWSYKTNGPIFSSPCIIKEKGFFCVGCHDTYLYCLSFDGNLIWKAKLNSPIYSSPTCAVSLGRGTNKVNVESGEVILACSTRGNLYTIDIFDGKIISSHLFQKEIFSSPVICKNFAFVGCRDDNVYCLELF